MTDADIDLTLPKKVTALGWSKVGEVLPLSAKHVLNTGISIRRCWWLGCRKSERWFRRLNQI